MEYAFALAAAAAVGSMIGSFFNVVIHRMPRGESVVFPASRCPACGYRIKPWENIPVFSWLWLRGRCAQCKAGISPEYLLIEAATGGWTALLIWDLLRHPQPAGTAVVFLYFALCAIPITVIDLRHYLIPDVLTLPGMGIALAASFLPAGLKPWESALGLLGPGLLLWSIGALASRLLKKDAMGFGDVKLLALAGACFGWKTAMLGLVFASFLGAAAGLLLLLGRRLGPERHIPFGPYLCAGTLLAARYGEDYLTWFWG